jgi:ABC-type lipoprotein release transport system permease subunit
LGDRPGCHLTVGLRRDTTGGQTKVSGESLLYQVKAADPDMLALPLLAILGVAVVATLPAILRASRIEPAEILRAE